MPNWPGSVAASPARGDRAGPVSRFVQRLRSRRAVVEDHSMEPDFLPGDRVWFDRGSYRDRPPSVGEVVVLQDPDGSGRRLIKSVAAVGPSTVWVVTDGVRLAPPGPERAARAPPDLLEEVEVGPGQLFVTSTKATGTRDSRSFGPVRALALGGRGVVPLRARGPAGAGRAYSRIPSVVSEKTASPSGRFGESMSRAIRFGGFDFLR